MAAVRNHPEITQSFTATIVIHPLLVRIDDPAGDHNGNADITRVILSFDDVTGDYQIIASTAAAHPFANEFRMNLNLLNVDRGANANEIAFFTSSRDHLMPTPTPWLSVSGNHLALRNWRDGDRIFPQSIAGNPLPSGVSSFRSAVTDIISGTYTIARSDFIALANPTLAAVVQRLQ
jgi:hypothetical protein